MESVEEQKSNEQWDEFGWREREKANWGSLEIWMRLWERNKTEGSLKQRKKSKKMFYLYSFILSLFEALTIFLA